MFSKELKNMLLALVGLVTIFMFTIYFSTEKFVLGINPPQIGKKIFDMGKTPPPGYSQGNCPIGFYDKTKGKYKRNICRGSLLCPNGYTDDNCNCACVSNLSPTQEETDKIKNLLNTIKNKETKPLPGFELKPPKGYSQGNCPNGFYDITKGKYKINKSCRKLCPNEYTDDNCNCACITNFFSPEQQIAINSSTLKKNWGI